MLEVSLGRYKISHEMKEKHLRKFIGLRRTQAHG